MRLGQWTHEEFMEVARKFHGYPAPGLIIGTVVKVDTRQGESTRRVIVSPNDTTGALEEVLVVFGVGAVGEADGNEGGDAS